MVQEKMFWIVCFLTLSIFLPANALAIFDPPVLIKPEDQARFGMSDGPVIFEWENRDADSYELELAIDEDFEISTGPIVTENTFYNLSDIIPDEIWAPLSIKLYWRVRCVEFLGIKSSWSNVRLMYKAPFDSPILLSPFNDERFGLDTDMPYFNWDMEPGMETFIIEFAMDSDFETSFGEIPLTDNYLDFATADPEAWADVKGIFYWRTCGVDTDDIPGPWSEIWFFSKTQLETPEPIGPDDGTRFGPQSDPAVIEWYCSGNPGVFELRFSLDREAEQVIGIMSHNEMIFDFGEYATDEEWWYAFANFYWSVSTYDDEGRPGPWSPAWEITKVGYHRVCAFGDSITEGEFVENGYLDILEGQLLTVWESVTTVNMAVGGTKSGWGEDNIERVLRQTCPQFILICFGANDVVDPYGCDPPYECDVAGHLRDMVQIAQSRGTIPIITTVLPVNPAGAHASAQTSVDLTNEEILDMVDIYHPPFVDINEMFWEYGPDLPSLFEDWGHPSYEGYVVMADGFFQGIMANGG
ncbi:SGNH/GDSL hydrolase family protein [bacterium]|nr:SGNH/GDSL hydrolase family protein [candidate division CSSED10-310 bacterium]